MDINLPLIFADDIRDLKVERKAIWSDYNVVGTFMKIGVKEAQPGDFGRDENA